MSPPPLLAKEASPLRGIVCGLPKLLLPQVKHAEEGATRSEKGLEYLDKPFTLDTIQKLKEHRIVIK